MAQIQPDIGIPTVNPEVAAPNVMQNAEPKAAAGAVALGQGATDLSKVFGQVQVNDVTNNVMAQARAITDHYQSLSGQDALHAQASTQEALNKVFADGANQLSTTDQSLQYNETTRTYQDRYFGGMIAQHAAQAARDYATTVNNSSFQNGLDTIGGNPNDPNAFQLGLNLAIGAKVKQLQLEGNAGDPNLMKQAVVEATQAAWLSRIQAVGAQDPAGALTLADNNQALLGDKYYQIRDSLRDRADQQSGVEAGQVALAGAVLPAPTPATPAAATGAPAAPAPKASSQQVWGAILGNESSGGNLNAPTSATGAVGAGQIEPATFQAAAKPGENINNPADNLAVSRRLINQYYTQYNGDAARVAVAYYSGPGNVAPAGSATPYIKNVSPPSGGPTVAQYVSNVTAKLQPGSPQDAKASAYANILDDPNLTPAARQHALEYVNQTISAQQISDQATAQQQELASQKAANNYTTQILESVSNGKGLDPGIAQSIAADPNLKADAKMALFDYTLRVTGNEKAIGYGPGYMDAYNKILAPYGTAGKITDATTILQMAGPGGPITPTGAQALIQTLSQSQSGIDGAGIANAKASVLNYAKSKLSFDGVGMPGGFQLKDPNGERAFDATFVPQFEASYNAWVKSGKDPMQFLQNTSNIDGMIAKIRPPSQFNADQMAAMGGTMAPPASAGPQPIPTPPTTVKDPGGWQKWMQQPPETQNGPIPVNQWSAAVSMLMQNPTQNIPLFDKTFGPYGYDGAEIVAQLSNAQTVSPPFRGH